MPRRVGSAAADHHPSLQRLAARRRDGARPGLSVARRTSTLLQGAVPELITSRVLLGHVT
eukprot:348586-Rhodomonas_salina.7